MPVLQNLWPFILAGLTGGIVRALVGLAKQFRQNTQDKKIRWLYLLLTLLASAFSGGLAGAIAGSDWRWAAIAGYAGSDFLEGLYRIQRGGAKAPELSKP